MRRNKKHYYVLVLGERPKFVTENNCAERYCKWEAKGKPYEFINEQDAQYTACGLTLNGNTAFAVTTHYEVDQLLYADEIGK